MYFYLYSASQLLLNKRHIPIRIRNTIVSAF
nr:MAG TPA: hypothetical protein [Caudoviricetes sp.]